MSALETYKAKKQAVIDAEAFLFLLQSGVVSSECDFVITRAGQSTPMPFAMKAAVHALVASRAGNILDAAVKQLRQEATAAGLAAKDEYFQLLRDDGIVTQGG